MKTRRICAGLLLLALCLSGCAPEPAAEETAPAAVTVSVPEIPEEVPEPMEEPAPEESIAEEAPAEPEPVSAPEPEPEPEEIPAPPQDDGTTTCTISIRCDTILQNMDALAPGMEALIPEDGCILAAMEVPFSEGESVFNVLQRTCKQMGIHMEFMNTPIYNSAYIEGIANLYEFDAGGLSGWMYRVNGWFPNYGCSSYFLQDGDVIEWIYTCDLGADVGGGSVNQKEQ